MKKITNIFILILVFITLSACSEIKEISIIGEEEIGVGQTTLLQVDGINNAKLIWSSSNEEIARVDEAGIVEGIADGTTIITVRLKENQTVSSQLTIRVINPNQEQINVINEIASFIDNQLPINATRDIILVTTYNDYQFSITYSSNNPTFLNHDGKVNRGSSDVDVILSYTISYNGVTLKFSKSIKVLKLSEIVLDGESEVLIGEEIKINATSSDVLTFVFESSNLSIFTVSSEGVIKGLKGGNANLKVSVKDDPLSFVTYAIKVIDPIEEVGTYLLSVLPTRTSSNIDFIDDHPVYQVQVEYNTNNSSFINNEGHVKQDIVDRNVFITIRVTLNSETRDFYKYITVEKIPVETQIANINSWLQNQVSPIITNESGDLPSIDGIYGRKINWVASYPGVVINNRINIAYINTDIKLIAKYQIETINYSYEFLYISRGANEMEKTETILNYFTNFYVPQIVTNRVIIPMSEEIDIIQSIVYPNTATKLRPGTGLNGVKMPGGVKYIVIHDTGMPNAEHNAVGVNKYIHDQANNPGGRVASWHFTVDENNIYQHVPDDEIAWHAGDGSRPYGSTYYNTEYKAWSIGGGNQNGIGIETCINYGGNYQRTLRRTAKLVANLLNKHNLGLDAIKQHNDFSGKNCPAVIRSTTGRWEEFIKEVEFHLFFMKVGGTLFDVSLSNNEAISIDGIVSKDIINTTYVDLKIQTLIAEKNMSFEMQLIINGMSASQKASHLHMYLYNNVVPRQTSESLNLPTYFSDYNATVTWSSSHPDILSNEGVYQKPLNATLVTYTIEIDIDGIKETKTLKVTVS